MIFRRNQLIAQTAEDRSELHKIWLEEGDPTSPHYQLPEWYDEEKKITAWSLAKWLEDVNEKRGWRPHFPLAVSMHQAKLLLEEYDPLLLVRAIHYAGQISRHPFSFGLVRRCLEYWEQKEIVNDSSNYHNSAPR